MQIVRLADVESSTTYVEDVSRWVTDAGSPYLPWLLGGEEATRRFVRARLHQAVSEFSAEYTYVLLDGDHCVGGFVALAGSALGPARRADLLAMAADAGATGRSALMNRLEATRDTFLAVPQECFYLSKVGVLERFRGRGLGSLLLREYLIVGSRNRFNRFRLDVSEDNAAAFALYARHGFARLEVRGSRELGLSYIALERDCDAK